jgi:PIN domain nuclease of toxin-antitoxin system
MARQAIAEDENDTYVSAVTAWEITTKFKIGKLREAELAARDVAAAIADQGFFQLPLTVHQAQLAGSMAGALRDPFDRMLIAQAMLENLHLVSNEAPFDTYAVKRLW